MTHSESNVVLRVLPATADAVVEGRQAVAELAARAGASEMQIDAVRLAVSEALTNAVVHGCRDPSGRITVTACLKDDRLWIIIADDGCGFRVPPDNPGLGLGLSLIEGASDDFAVTERSGGGTAVQMNFQVRAAASAGPLNRLRRRRPGQREPAWRPLASQRRRSPSRLTPG